MYSSLKSNYLLLLKWMRRGAKKQLNIVSISIYEQKNKYYCYVGFVTRMTCKPLKRSYLIWFAECLLEHAELLFSNRTRFHSRTFKVWTNVNCLWDFCLNWSGLWISFLNSSIGRIDWKFSSSRCNILEAEKNFWAW